MSFLKTQASAAARMERSESAPRPSHRDMVIYDGEMTGTNQRYDQILQFSGLKTDMSFEMVGEPFDFRARRLPYVVSSPKAMAVTGITADVLDDPSLMSEFEMAGAIHSVIRPRGDDERTHITFNGLKFDDGFLRYMWFRNLLDAYPCPKATTTRIDTYHLAQLAFTACPGTFASAPAGTEGAWKLETIARLNGIGIRAHDGLSDALATKDLACLIHDKARWAWDSASHWGREPAAQGVLDSAKAHATTMWWFSPYDRALHPVVVIGDIERRSWLMFDLDRDPADIEVEKLDGKLGSWLLQGFQKIKSNRAPLFVTEAEVSRFGGDPDRQTYSERAARLSSDRSKVTAIMKRFGLTECYGMPTSPTSEDRIYENFFGRTDKSRMARFRSAESWDERCSIAFEDTRLIDFSCRILAMTAPEFPRPDQLDTLAYIRNIASEAMSRPYRIDDVPWTTLMSATPTADRSWLEWAVGAFAGNNSTAPVSQMSGSA